jgi:hypothetical protein
MMIDAVKIEGRFRLCHGGTEEVVLVGEDNPADRFESCLNEDAAKEGEKVWMLMRRAGHLPSGFTTKAAALRCAEMLIEAGIELLSQEVAE